MLVATSSMTGVRANQPKKARKKEILGVAGSHKKKQTLSQIPQEIQQYNYGLWGDILHGVTLVFQPSISWTMGPSKNINS